jgi:hypothetical protein
MKLSADALATWAKILAAFASIFLLAVFTPASWPDTLVMPRELVDSAHANGCTPIDNFFERPGMVNPPYVYGWLPGGDEDSAVFWCKKVEKSVKPYNLMFTMRDRSSFAMKLVDPKQLEGCPAVIEWSDFPRGLTIRTRPNLGLHDLHYVNTAQRSGPTTVVPNAKVIVNYYDGVTELFYCYRGGWLFKTQE